MSEVIFEGELRAIQKAYEDVGHCIVFADEPFDGSMPSLCLYFRTGSDPLDRFAEGKRYRVLITEEEEG